MLNRIVAAFTVVSIMCLSGCGALGGAKSTSLAITNKLSTATAGMLYTINANVNHDQGKGCTWTSSGPGTFIPAPVPNCLATYLAPPTVPKSGNSVTITASAANGSGSSDSFTFSIVAANVPVVSISPVTFTVTSGSTTQQLTITVSGDTPADVIQMGFTSAPQCGTSGQFVSCGTFSHFTGNPGGGSYTVLFTPAPGVPSTVTGQQITAKSNLQNAEIGYAFPTINPGSGGGGGGGGGANALCAPQGAESALKGSWVFLEEGAPSSGGHLGIAGTFVADGAGGMTSGSWDVAIPFAVPMASFTVDPSSSNTGSSYSIDSSGRGCIAFAYTNPANNNVTTSMYRIVMAGYSNGAPTSGYVMDSAKGTYATGLILPGSSNVTDATLKGSYVFGLAGEANATAASLAGNITFDGNGGIDTAANGLGDSDVVGTHSSSQAIAAGTYNLSANGRGTISFTVGSVPIKGVMYVSQTASSLFILSGGATAYSVLSGRAVQFQGMGAAPNASVAGYQLLAIHSSKAATVGIANIVPSNANMTDGTITGTLWQAGGGNSQSMPMNGTYSVTDPTYGRITFTGIGTNPPVMYSTGGNSGIDGFFVGTNGGVDTGRMVFQSSAVTNFSDSNLPSGSKAVYTQFERDFTSNQYVARIGQITFDGIGGFSGTYDENGPNGLLTNQAVNANYGLNTDGSGFFEQNTWPWVSRIDHSYYIDENLTNLNPIVGDVAKQ
jgi:hypothetical protein